PRQRTTGSPRPFHQCVGSKRRTSEWTLRSSLRCGRRSPGGMVPEGASPAVCGTGERIPYTLAPMTTRSGRPRWLSSTALIFYALILGVLCGHLLPAEHHPAAFETFRFMSRAFINLIKMLIVPLIFSTIVVGIGKTGDIKAVGRMGIKALVYFEIATTAALALGLAIAHLVQPGHGLTLPPSGETVAPPKSLVDSLLH